MNNGCTYLNIGTGWDAISTDNCSTVTMIYELSGSTTGIGTSLNNVAFNSGITTVKWIVTDLGGNMVSCSFTVNVTDETKPIFTVPEDIIICRSTDCSYSIDPSVTGQISNASDNCTPTTLLGISYEDSDLSGLSDCSKFWTVIRTWIITDQAGNETVHTQTITVEPTVTIKAINDTICNGTETNILVESENITTNGIRYTWTVTENPKVTGEVGSSGQGLMTGLPIVQALTNSSQDTAIVRYRITPWTIGQDGNNQCPGVPVDVAVWVEPTVVITAGNDTICNNTSTNIMVSSLSTVANDIRYTWTVIDNPKVTGEASSIGEGQLIGTPIVQTLINISQDTAVVRYYITPWPVDNAGNNRCAGVPMIVDVWIEPTVIITADNDTICNNETTEIMPVTKQNTTNGIRFTWTVSDNPYISGATASVGNGQMIGTPILNTLHNTSNSPQMVTYRIIPHTIDNNGNNKCQFNYIDIDIWVEPTVVITAENDTICNNTATAILPVSEQVTTKGIMYTWTVTENPYVSGETGSTGNGQALGTAIIQTLNNTSSSAQMVTYRIIPHTKDNNGNNVCLFDFIEIEVWVEPTPEASLVTTTPVLCNGNNISILIESPTVTTIPDKLDYRIDVASTDAEHLGGTASSGFIIGKHDLPFPITGTLINTSDSPITVTYTVTPRITGCSDGEPFSIVVLVNPTPRATPVNVKPAICYSEDTQITLISPTEMSSGEIRFDYTIALPSGITGVSDPGIDKEQGDELSFQYWNNNDTVQSVYFLITPKVVGLDCPAGDAKTVEVRMHPEPARGINITKPFTCEVNMGHAALEAQISKGAGPYSILWTGPVGYVMKDSIEITNLYAGGYVLNVTDSLGCQGDADITIANLSAFPVIIPLSVRPNIHVSCPGGNDGRARIYVRNGITFPYQYWVVRNDVDTLYSGVFSGNYNSGDPSTFRICTGMPAGIYTMIVHDINGCETFMMTQLEEPEPIVTSFRLSDYDEANISCRGYEVGFAEATVTGGNGFYNYFWYPANGSLHVSNNTSILDSIPAGKYYLQITDLAGCEKIDSVTLIDPPGMYLSKSEVSVSRDKGYNISCNGASDGFIKITVSGGSGLYTYSWSGPDGYSSTRKEIEGLKAGTYDCIVRDINGCVLTPIPSFTLKQPEQLIIHTELSSSDYGSWNMNCYGETGSVDVTVTDGIAGSYTYEWSTSDGSGILQGREDQDELTAGDYHLVVSDLNGCVQETDIRLSQPPELVTEMVATHITCQASGLNNGSINLTVSGGMPPYLYSWSNGSTDQDIFGLTEGYYLVDVIDANGCQKKDSVRINRSPSISYELVLSGYNGFNISCNGRADGFIRVNPTSGTPPYIFNWQGPEGFLSISDGLTGLKAGQYILNITDGNMCSTTDTILLTEPGKISMAITTSNSMNSGHNINCAGGKTGSITVEAVNNAGSVAYLWADGEIGSERSGLMAGNYKIIITDSNGCSADSVITLSAPDSIRILFSVKQPFCTDMPDGEISAVVSGGTNTGFTYRWFDNSTLQNLTDVVSGLYILTVTDANGCTARDSVMVLPINEVCMEIPNAISPNGDLINDEWNIGHRDLYPDMEVKIFNRWGELVWKSTRGYTFPWDGRSNGNVLPIDSYHYIIDLHNGSKPVIGHVTIVK
jgi:gliding motility-associated-like protein